MSDEANRRRHQRVDIALLVQYRYGSSEEFQIDYALNLSQSGLFIDAETDREPGTRVFIQLTTRDGQHFLQGEGVVIRKGKGTAIELVGFDEESRAVLDELVQRTIEDQGAGA